MITSSMMFSRAEMTLTAPITNWQPRSQGPLSSYLQKPRESRKREDPGNEIERIDWNLLIMYKLASDYWEIGEMYGFSVT